MFQPNIATIFEKAYIPAQDHRKQIYGGSLSKNFNFIIITIIFTASVIIKPYTNNFMYFFSFIPRAAYPHYVFPRNNIHVRFKISNPNNCEYFPFYLQSA